MARIYKTLSLSLHPDVIAALEARGKRSGKVAARVAVEIVKRDVAAESPPRMELRWPSWCCAAPVIPTPGRFVIDAKEIWIHAIVLLCSTCHRQLQGREYEGWSIDA